MKKLKTNKVYIGNCLEVLKTFPDESLDMCITSPPYWGLRDYGTEGQIWGGDDKCKHDFDKSKRKLHSGSWGKDDNVLPHYKNATELNWEVEDAMCNKCGAWNGQLGLEPSPDMFVSNLCDIFDEIKRCLRPHGTCWVNLGDTYANSGHGKGTGSFKNKNNPGTMTPKVKCDLPQKCLVQIPSRFAIEMTNRGWILRNEIIWHKPSCLPSPATDRFTVDFEKMFFFTKNKKYYFKQQFEELSYSYMKDKRPAVLRNKLYEDSKYVKSGMMEKVPYAVQPRTKEFINYRDLPKHDDIREYLTEWKDKMGITIKEIEEHFGTQAGHHWFEKDSSYPSVEDWKGLKELLEFDDKYDEVMTTEHVKSSEKTHDPRGRNKRAVWSINTASFKGAHFAVYPPTLIETPIDAGCPEYIDKKTGIPRERTLEKKSLERYELPKDDPNYRPERYEGKHKDLLGYTPGQKYATYDDKGYTDGRDDDEFTPGVVLDPFFGSGTTAEVAMKQGKDWVGIELNGDYEKISQRRLKPRIVEKKTKDKAKEFWN